MIHAASDAIEPLSRGAIEDAALHVEQVRVTYRTRGASLTALDGVSLAVPAGEAAALLGPNGSGKSTLMRVICGSLRPDSGSVRMFGSAEIREIRTSLGVVFQSPSLDPHMTVWENLRDQAMLHGLSVREAKIRVDQGLARIGIPDRKHALVKSLSGGLARRIDLLRAMLHQPRFLLLDEPTVGLDPAARERFLQELDDLRREHGLTVLMTTHLVDEADRADRVLFMHLGRIAAQGAPTALRRSAGSRWVTVPDPRWQPNLEDGIPWERAASGWRTRLDDEAQAVPLAARLAAAGLAFTVAPPTLADVFAQVTGEPLSPHAAA